MNKLILSRKGFDSSAGGCPNPIFPDGSMLALPIPDGQSRIKYRDVKFGDTHVGNLVNHLTKGRVKANHRAHLDPDMIAASYPRESGWKPLLGQTGAAQGHLAKQGVLPGDLFLFFGLFREVERYKRRWRYVSGTVPKHILWGWLQIETIVNVDSTGELMPNWVDYHPHLYREKDKNNTLYFSCDDLDLGRSMPKLPGAGCFPKYMPALCLTAPESTKPSYWKLPKWFFPNNKTPLSYHYNRARWELGNEHCYLQCAARGQEFVLPVAEYPSARPWVVSLLQNALGI